MLVNPWRACPHLPVKPAAVLSALHLTEPDYRTLDALHDSDWKDALAYCDRSRLTLALAGAAYQHLPPWARERVDRNLDANRLRLRGIQDTHRALSQWLAAGGFDFVVLKGITHAALFGLPADTRVQYDIDLLLPRDTVQAAQLALVSHGYTPMPGMDDYPTDHLPALVRKTGWQWRGDFFDTEIPLSVELHHQLWNPGVERLPAPGIEEFWARRTRRQVDSFEIGVLAPSDALGYACLHLMRHLLRGSVRPFHVYEIACLLDSLAEDARFWEQWRALHSPEMRLLETIAFRLAQAWFGGHAAPLVEEELVRLPCAVEAWFREFGTTPATSAFHPNKDELWLHLSLVASRRDAWSIAFRRLAPRKLPNLNTSPNVPEGQLSLQQRIGQRLRWMAYAAGRARHHAIAFPKTAVSGARWWYRTNHLGEQFWIFLAAAVIFNFGLFVFVLLYNLFLLDLGYREDFIGVMSAAQRTGSVVGTIPGAWLAYRFGLKKTLLGAIAGIALTEVLRALIGARFPLTALAFVSGCIFSAWAVILAPSIAGTVEERLRPTAFSVFFATMFGVGMVGNWVGGWLPTLMHGKQPVLLVSAAIAALALLPALRLRPSPGARPGERVYPRSKFLLRYLAPFAVWHLATGAFNPFTNVYFSRLGFAVERIGAIFSGSQLVQVLTVLSAPWITRRLGLLTGIVWMMAATSIGLFGLASQPPAAAAITAYIAYMSCQWMSEPGLNSLLMNQIAERERSGASALNFLVAFGAQALAAWGAGRLFASTGYGPVLSTAGVLVLIAAVMFYGLLRNSSNPRSSA